MHAAACVTGGNCGPTSVQIDVPSEALSSVVVMAPQMREQGKIGAGANQGRAGMAMAREEGGMRGETRRKVPGRRFLGPPG